MENNSWSKVDLIREVFHYQSRFEGSIMVFKIDYPVTEDPGFPRLVKDLALLAKTGFKVIIVPGAKENIDAVLKQHDIGSSRCDAPTHERPIRVTTAQAIPYVEMSAFNVASRFLTFLTGSRVEAMIGNFVRARGLGVVNGIDTEHTGVVDKIYADSLVRVLNLGMVPILPCIGWSPSGKPYNVLSDEIAIEVSKTLGAEKLFIVRAVSGSSGIKELNLDAAGKPETRSDGSLIRLTPAQAQALISANADKFDSGNENQGLKNAEVTSILRDLKFALHASQAGVHRIHIVDGRDEGSVLKELFSNLGVGTMIYADEYDAIRSFHSSDLPEILRLMEPLMKSGILIRRTPEQIQEKKADYSVLEIDGSVRACAALHNWGEGQCEIAAVATDPQYTDLGLGKRIIGCLIEKARKINMRRVFALTTQTQDWFESLGFKEAAVESLPELKRKVYDYNRNSKVFALDIK